MGFLKLSRVSSLFLVLCLVLYCFSPEIHRLGDHVRQTNPLSGQRHVEQAFTPTPGELACLHGLSPRPGGPSHHVSPDPDAVSVMGTIPNIVHFIFLQRLPLGHAGQGDFDFLAYLSVRSAIVSLRPDRVLLHYSYTGQPYSQRANGTTEARDDPLIDRNPWIRRLKANVELVRHRRLDSSLHHAEHLADTMRLEVLLAHGGIYMDIDAFALRPFTDILSTPRPHDVVLGNEGGNRAGLCNAIVAARPNSAFVERWLQTYKGVDLNKEWNYHSVVLPKLLAAKHPDEVCELPPDAFFWPTWTWRHVQWMHEPIDRAEARWWQGKMEQTGGGLFENQLAYHAWSQMARGRFLERLTPQVVRDEDTRFNLLMRRFVEEDL